MKSFTNRSSSSTVISNDSLCEKGYTEKFGTSCDGDAMKQNTVRTKLKVVHRTHCLKKKKSGIIRIIGWAFHTASNDDDACNDDVENCNFCETAQTVCLGKHSPLQPEPYPLSPPKKQIVSPGARALELEHLFPLWVEIFLYGPRSLLLAAELKYHERIRADPQVQSQQVLTLSAKRKARTCQTRAQSGRARRSGCVERQQEQGLNR